MHVAKLHRYVSRSGPVSAVVLAARALEAAENEGWPILPPVVWQGNGRKPIDWELPAKPD